MERRYIRPVGAWNEWGHHPDYHRSFLLHHASMLRRVVVGCVSLAIIGATSHISDRCGFTSSQADEREFKRTVVITRITRCHTAYMACTLILACLRL